MRHAFMTVIVVLFTGCTGYRMTTAGRPPAHVLSPPPPGAGQICVLRPHSVASLAPVVVHDNGHLVGMTRGPTYFCYLAQPGTHRVASTYGDDIDRKLGTDQIEDASVHVAPSRRYFLHHDVTNPLHLSVRWVTEEAARPMLDSCQYAQLVEVPGDEALPEPDRMVPAATR